MGFKALERGNCGTETHGPGPQAPLRRAPPYAGPPLTASPNAEASRPRAEPRGRENRALLGGRSPGRAGRGGAVASPHGGDGARPQSPRPLGEVPPPLGALRGGRALPAGAASRLSGGHGCTSPHHRHHHRRLQPRREVARGAQRPAPGCPSLPSPALTSSRQPPSCRCPASPSARGGTNPLIQARGAPFARPPREEGFGEARGRAATGARLPEERGAWRGAGSPLLAAQRVSDRRCWR